MQDVQSIPLTILEVWQKLRLPMTLRWVFLAAVASVSYALWAPDHSWFVPVGGFDVMMALLVVDEVWFLNQ